MTDTDAKRLLVVDDEPGHRLMVRAVMEEEGWTVAEAENGETGLDAIASGGAAGGEPDVVLLDMRMPGMSGEETLQRILADRPHLPVIMLTAYGTVGSAVDAMKLGAFDYLTKPADNEELAAQLEKAWSYGKLLKENAALKAQLDGVATPEIVGSGTAMREVLDLVQQAGPTEATVLITGESGTGKELLAEALHRSSRRADKPLVKVNCAALPENLLESELFGYAKGAFTGAVKDKPGRFQLADKGTLFLDEIGELPMPLQAKLLRALQERVVEPLGGVNPVEVDVRILAATNKDLGEEVREGRFREDLYYRLNVLELHAPPLRERTEDLPELVSHLLRKLSKKNAKDIRAVSPLFLEGLAAYNWPGNVRELENVLERALILSRSDTLGPETLPASMRKGGNGGADGAADGQGAEAPLSVSVEDAEREALVRALEANKGHRERTAEALGVSRRTLQYKLSKYGLTRRG